jgi:hypothetical protein
MTFIAIAAFLLLLVVVGMVARPLLVPSVAGPAVDEDDSELEQQKALLLDAIREVDMDLATGKLSVEDHRGLRAQLVAEATSVMQRLDEEEAATLVAASATASEAATSEAATEAASEEAAPEGPVDAARTAEVEDALDDVEAAIEDEVARRRERLAAGDCSTCREAREAGDAFCRRCGAALDILQEARS